MRNKKKIILPPQLPPDISEDEIEVSDEDKAFVSENKDYAGFLSTLDTTSITKFVPFPPFHAQKLQFNVGFCGC